MPLAEATEAHRRIGDQIPQFFNLVGLVPSHLPVGVLSRQPLAFDVQTLLLDAGAVVLDAVLSFQGGSLLPLSRDLLLLMLDQPVPLVDRRKLPQGVDLPLVLLHPLVDVAHNGKPSAIVFAAITMSRGCCYPKRNHGPTKLS